MDIVHSSICSVLRLLSRASSKDYDPRQKHERKQMRWKRKVKPRSKSCGVPAERVPRSSQAWGVAATREPLASTVVAPDRLQHGIIVGYHFDDA